MNTNVPLSQLHGLSLVLKGVVIVLALSLQAVAFAGSYYLSSSEGDDNNDGSIEYPWKTLAKISLVTLAPGDVVSFRRGDRFDGHFVVRGSGSEEAPITITAYGEGNHPVITGEAGAENGGDYQEAILVRNYSHYVFEGLEINNERSSNRPGIDERDAFGIHVQSTNAEVMRNFTFRNMVFRNIYAVKPILPDEGHDAFNGLVVAGLRIRAEQNWHGGIHDVLVEDCFFTDIQRLGVHMSHSNGSLNISAQRRSRDLIFRNNEFQHTGGTCILPTSTINVLIENNLFFFSGSDADPRMPNRGSAVWTWRCTNTVIQHNYCISARGYLDSHGIHVDHQNRNTFIQYNYMEDNEGGFVEILGGNVNTVYRFNISVNEGWRNNGPDEWDADHTIWINDGIPGGKQLCDHTYIYNNTVFTDFSEGTRIRVKGTNNFIYNNIFHSPAGRGIGGDGFEWSYASNDPTMPYISNNLYQLSDNRLRDRDANPVAGNPRFSDPGSGSAYGYQVTGDSPAINNGVARLGPPVPGAGEGIFKDLVEYPVVDFFGNPLDLSSVTPNIGASNSKTGEILNKPAAPVTRVALFPGVNELAPTDTLQLNSYAMPVLADQTGLTWSTDNEEVATVSPDGFVIAHKPGMAIIKATSSNGKEGTSEIRVRGSEVAISGGMKIWLQEHGYDLDTTNLDQLTPSGFPLILHYAMGVPPTQAVTFHHQPDGQSHLFFFNGSRRDISYQALMSEDLSTWEDARLSSPNDNGERMVSVRSGQATPEFYRIAVSIRRF
jgi:hypothetical protein